MEGLENQVAVVTGSGRGIGRAVAHELAGRGARIVVNDAGVDPDGAGHSSGPATEVADEIESAGGRAVANDADVSSWSGAASLIDTAISVYGRVDILVNNAGIVRYRSFEHMTEQQWDAVLAVHLKGTFNCCRHAVPRMLAQGHGRIVNMISAAAQGFPVQANYVAAKAGVLGLTMALAVELGDRGITANALAPSGHTRLLADLRPDGDDDEAAANGPIVAWLASGAASHVNGQVFGWGGGRYALYGQILTPATTLHADATPTSADFRLAFDPFLQPVGRAVDEEVIARFIERVDRTE